MVLVTPEREPEPGSEPVPVPVAEPELEYRSKQVQVPESVLAVPLPTFAACRDHLSL